MLCMFLLFLLSFLGWIIVSWRGPKVLEGGWVSVNSTSKVYDCCIRDLGFNLRLYQKLIGVLFWSSEVDVIGWNSLNYKNDIHNKNKKKIGPWGRAQTWVCSCKQGPQSWNISNSGPLCRIRALVGPILMGQF